MLFEIFIWFQTEADIVGSGSGEEEGALGNAVDAEGNGSADGANESEGGEADSSRGGDEEQDDEDEEEMYESSDQGMDSLDFDQ